MTTGIRQFSRIELEEVADQIIGKRLSGRPEQFIHEVSAIQNYVIGSKMVLGRGLEIFRYGQADAANPCTLGLLHQSPVPVGAQVDMPAPVAHGVGITVIGLTLGAAVAANEYAGGWLYVNDGTSQGECLRILSHPAAGGAALCLFTCLDGLTIAFDGTEECSLVANPYNGVIVHAGAPDAPLVGVPRVTIAAGSFGWFQRRGPAAVLIGTTAPVVNDLVGACVAVPGAVDVYIAGGALGIVGEVMRTDAATDTGMINLMLE